MKKANICVVLYYSFLHICMYIFATVMYVNMYVCMYVRIAIFGLTYTVNMVFKSDSINPCMHTQLTVNGVSEFTFPVKYYSFLLFGVTPSYIWQMSHFGKSCMFRCVTRVCITYPVDHFELIWSTKIRKTNRAQKSIQSASSI